jgi:hypothetical protein
VRLDTKAVVHEPPVVGWAFVHEISGHVDSLWMDWVDAQDWQRAYPPRANISTFGSRSVALLRSSE